MVEMVAMSELVEESIATNAAIDNDSSPIH
jgi:hypothetical protein